MRSRVSSNGLSLHVLSCENERFNVKMSSVKHDRLMLVIFFFVVTVAVARKLLFGRGQTINLEFITCT